MDDHDDRYDPESTVYSKPDPETAKPVVQKGWGITMKEFLFKEFDAGRGKELEVQSLVRMFGRERIHAIYLEWKASRGKT